MNNGRFEIKSRNIFNLIFLSNILASTATLLYIAINSVGDLLSGYISNAPTSSLLNVVSSFLIFFSPTITVLIFWLCEFKKNGIKRYKLTTSISFLTAIVFWWPAIIYLGIQNG
jgi:hypothetical protein